MRVERVLFPLSIPLSYENFGVEFLIADSSAFSTFDNSFEYAFNWVWSLCLSWSNNVCFWFNFWISTFDCVCFASASFNAFWSTDSACVTALLIASLSPLYCSFAFVTAFSYTEYAFCVAVESSKSLFDCCTKIEFDKE